MGRATIFTIVALSATTQALTFSTPRATGLAIIPTNAQSPRPTTPPIFKELRRRQSSSSDETFLVAPDNTCGYVSGQSSAYYTCNGETDLCVFLTASGNLPGAVGCCDKTDCGFRITCYDYDQISTSSLCDSDCMTNTYTAKCTATTAKFCGTISFDGDILDYFCNSRNISTPMVATTTYSGETGRSFTELVLTSSSSIPLSSTSSTTESSIITDPTSSTTSSATSTTTTASSGGGGSSAPVGAIVGGVVGGLAVLALLLFGVFFILRSNKKKAAATGPPTQPQQPGYPQMAQQQPQPPPNQGPYYAGQPDPTKVGQQVPYVQQQNYVSPSPPSAPQFNTSPNQYAQGYQGGYFPAGQDGMQQQQQQYPGGMAPGQMPDPSGNTSPLSDGNRISQLPTSPASGTPSYQQFYSGQPAVQPGIQQPSTGPIHEAGGNVVGATDYNANHPGQMYEVG